MECHSVKPLSVFVHNSNVNTAKTDQLYFVLQPAQLLKGDIMVSRNKGDSFFFKRLRGTSLSRINTVQKEHES